MATMLAIGLVILAVLVGSFGPIFLKKSSSTFTIRRPLDNLKNHNLFIGLLFYAFGTVCFVPALKYGELSVLYPLLSLGYVVVALYSRIILKEKMNIYKYAGIAAILVGVSLIGIGSV
jgi:multidrug transporter EmrE-like cation transporter